MAGAFRWPRRHRNPPGVRTLARSTSLAHVIALLSLRLQTWRMRFSISAATVVIAFCGGGLIATAAPHSEVASRPLEMRTLQASVVRMGLLHGEPSYGLRLRAFVCSRSSAEADRTVPTSF